MGQSFIISQILIGIAIIFDIVSFQLKSRVKIITCLTISCLLISAHFALLHKWTAMSLVFLSALRCATSIVFTSKKVMAAFAFFYMLATILTYNGLISVLSCLGSVIGTVGTFCKNDKNLREIVMLGSMFWLTHNILVKSPGAVIMESIFICSNVVGYYRYYLKKSSAHANKRTGETNLPR